MNSNNLELSDMENWNAIIPTPTVARSLVRWLCPRSLFLRE
jgi:hypothetical protein